MNAALLRSQIESVLGFPLTYQAATLETISIPVLDPLTGGLPRGELTEICGPESSGRTSLLLSILAETAENGELCALLDGRDSLDPHSAAAAGLNLNHLLWVRCHAVEQALRSAELILEGGGFGVVAMDLAAVPVRFMRRISLSAWFRLRGAVRNTRTALLVLEREPTAGTSASLVLRLGSAKPSWSRGLEISNMRGESPSHACLLSGLWLNVEALRSRRHPLSVTGRQRSAIRFQQPA